MEKSFERHVGMFILAIFDWMDKYDVNPYTFSEFTKRDNIS